MKLPHSIRRVSASLSLALLFAMMLHSACDSGTAPIVPPSLRITQPVDSQVVNASVLRILTETSSQCGCDSYVEFYINGVHTYTDYLPFFYFDWDIRGLSGEYLISARLVEDYDDASDTVRVFIE
ncbi:MAG: hypothetical protein KFH87_02580 [Bacteroidetes bacterium]|nr:hypothetical protein [Bacteroidota bacterium]